MLAGGSVEHRFTIPQLFFATLSNQQKVKYGIIAPHSLSRSDGFQYLFATIPTQMQP